MKWYDKILFCFFPNRCAYCNCVIDSDSLRCENCETKLVFIGDDICTLCGFNIKDCVCKKHKHEYNAIIAPYYYDSLPRNAVHILKFHKNIEGVNEIAFQIDKKIKRNYVGIDFDFVTSVPMSKKKQQQRGFNQAELIAKEIACNLDKKYVQLLKKVYDNEEQHLLDFEKRKGNVVGVYDCINTENLLNKNILLIDDVKTSGATLNECAKILKLNGANSVYCATFAVSRKKSH